MGSTKWIAGILGFIVSGPLGALAGYALGWLFEQGLKSPDGASTGGGEGAESRYNRQQIYEGQRNSFFFSMLVLASYIIKSDGKIMHSEMEFVRNFLRQNFGEAAVQQGEGIMLRLFEQQNQMGKTRFKATINDACRQIAQHMDYAQRLQLLNFLVMIAQADGNVAREEIEALKEVTASLGISQSDLESMLNLRDGSSSLEAAYKILGVDPSATDDEVKTAYRKMALKHHPDRVATLGEDVRKAAEKKFQEINDAKEKIYKARGI